MVKIDAAKKQGINSIDLLCEKGVGKLGVIHCGIRFLFQVEIKTFLTMRN